MKTHHTLSLLTLPVSLLALAGVAVAQEEPTTRRITAPGATGAQVQINQIETSQFPRVVIFATVVKDGEPVPGLTDKDFRVREDEVDQEPLTVVPKLTPLSAVMTLDTSGSMKKRLAEAQSAAKSFIRTLDPQDKVQVIRFSRDVKTIHPLGGDRAGADAAIDGTVARGDTALWDALFVSVESLRTVSGRKAIVLLSDGVDDDGTGKPLSKRTVTEVLAAARQVNTPIYAIGLGTELDEVNLRKVATESGAFYLSATDPAELKRLYDNIGKQLAGQYTIYYNSNLPADGTDHRVQLKFSDSTSTKAYQAPMRAALAARAPVVQKPTEPPPAELPDWLPVYPGSKPEGVSIATDPATGKRVGSFFFRTTDEKSKVMDFYEDQMTRASWDISRAPTQVWGGSDTEGRKFEVEPAQRGDQVRATVKFEEKKASAPATRAATPPASATPPGTTPAIAATPPDWLPTYPGSKPEGVSIATDPKTGKRTGSFFFRTTDAKSKVMQFYEDQMTRATWDVSHAPTQVWGSSKSEGRKFEVEPTHRGDETRVRVVFEDKEAR